MCGRFALTTPPDVIARWYELMQRLEFGPRYNIAPTQPIVAVRNNANQQREGVMLRWGLVPFWAKDPSIGSRLINARSESAAEKPSFREAMKKRRCLIPASGFYEWKKIGGAKQPYYITREDRDVLTFAGLWEFWKDKDTGEAIESCTILTTTANKSLHHLHERMPVLLPREAWQQWLDVEQYDPKKLSKLLKPEPEKGWTILPVNRRVNSPANDDPTVLETVEVMEREPPEKRRPATKRKGTSKQRTDDSGTLFQ
jgi:putative SOS response-associated peptidase YedK